MTQYDVWTVKEFLEYELQGAKELYLKTKDPMLPHVIEYLEKRLNGEIQ